MKEINFKLRRCYECGCDSNGSVWGIYCSYYCFNLNRN